MLLNDSGPRQSVSQSAERSVSCERFGFIAARNWFASPAHFVNGRGHSSSVEFGLSVFHMCPHHVGSQFHTDPMLLSFSVWRRFHHGNWRCRLPPVVSGIPHCTSASMAIRGVPCAGLGPEQSSSGLPLSRDCALFVARGPVRHAFPFNLLNSA